MMSRVATRNWEIVIPNFRPASVNELLKGGPWGAARLKTLDREFITVYARFAQVPWAIGKRRVSLRIALPKGQRRWDDDALWKSTLDALVSARMLIDDGPKWCQIGSVTYERTGILSTTIILDDLSPESPP